MRGHTVVGVQGGVHGRVGQWSLGPIVELMWCRGREQAVRTNTSITCPQVLWIHVDVDRVPGLIAEAPIGLIKNANIISGFQIQMADPWESAMMLSGHGRR